MSDLIKKIEIMQAFLEGKPIQCRRRRLPGLTWQETKNPSWNWSDWDYQICPEIPDSINWDHVSPTYKWMARDKNGTVHLYVHCPSPLTQEWGGSFSSRADVFKSYVRGNVNWDHSLVERN